MHSNANPSHRYAYFKQQCLNVFSYNKSSVPQFENWLSDCNWQSSSSVAAVQKNLLKHESAYLLVDLRFNPQKMLADVSHIKKHVGNVVVLGLVDEHSNPINHLVAQFGVSALVIYEHISQVGLQILFESLSETSPNRSNALLLSENMTIHEELYFDRLNHALIVAGRHQCLTGILLIHIDQQASINQIADSSVKDLVIAQVAIRVNSAIRNSDSLALLKDDVFAVLLEDLNDEIMVSQIAKNIQQAFENDIFVEQQAFSLTITIGGHLCDHKETNGLALHNQANIALQRALQNGEKGLWFYLQEMNFKAMARQNIISSLLRATQKNEFMLQYQPIHSGKGLGLRGVDSQLRWRHSSAGVLAPEIFISLLNSSGLIIDVGKAWIKNACEQIQIWKQQGNWSGLNQMLIDITEKQLRQGSLIDVLIEQLGSYAIAPEQIVLMFDESVVLRNISAIKNINKFIPSICIGVRLKEFSKGYSSLNYLKAIEVECLSLDNSFFQHLHVDHIETSMVKIIIDVAHTLGIEVMATGADSQFKLEKMKALGCDRIAGDYLSAFIEGENWANYVRSPA